MIYIAILVVVGLIILLAWPRLSANRYYKKLTSLLSEGKYDEFEKTLDGFMCTAAFRPFNREYMRLTAYIMQQDVKKIDEQINNLFDRIKMNDAQEAEVAKQAFYFYLETKKYKETKKMLQICQEKSTNTSEVKTMELMYSVLADKKSEHIPDLKKQLEGLKKNPSSQANTVRMGIYEYLIGLQYTYLNNKKESKKYLEAALEHCKGTPYQRQIEDVLWH